MNKALVTGASGFIGQNLVRHLSSLGWEVRCLVRPKSSRSVISQGNVELVEGSLDDLDSLQQAVVGIDAIFHLAGVTKALQKKTLWDVNEAGSRRLAQACAEVESPPTLIAVSSLAAAGPVVKMKPGEQVAAPHHIGSFRVRRETDRAAPVSDYGRSKLAGELAMISFSDRIPMTIVRPPIVLGPADRDGLDMFRSIARLGLHFVPGWRSSLFSIIHVEDLVRCLTNIAAQSERCTTQTMSANAESGISPEEYSQGIYFVGDPAVVTYTQLGKMIGKAVGKDRVRCIRVPPRMVRVSGLINQGISYLRGQPHILGIDKAREATAPGWACDPAKSQRDGAAQYAVDLQTRLNETAQWYRNQGWL